MTISDTLVSKLNATSLVSDKAFLAGRWAAKSDSGKTSKVTNPPMAS